MPMPMRIDRASFLSLTLGMAGTTGAACNMGPAPATANRVEIPPQPPQPSMDGGTATGVAKSEDPPVLPRASSSDDEQDDAMEGEDAELGDPTDEGGVPFAVARAPSSSHGCGWADPKTLHAPTVACSNDLGTVGSCSVQCAGFSFPQQKCEAYRRFLKPKVAQRALSCITQLGKKACDACDIYRCGDVAMKSACLDPAVDATCTQLTSKCKSLSLSDCRRYLSGLNPLGRTRIVSCLGTASGCGFGIYSCAEGLF